MEAGGEGAAEAGRAGEAVDRIAVVLFLTVETGADPGHLLGADGVNRLTGLLLRVDAEAAEEIGEAFDFAPGAVEAGERAARELVAED